VSQLAPAGTDPSDLVLAWVRTWLSDTQIDLYPTPHRARVGSVLLCPWLKATPANACNDDCSSCASTRLDLTKAPFRFMGVANRMDLRTAPDDGAAGEGRLLYALTDGPADDPSSPPLAMTAIFEYRLLVDADHSVQSWAKAWHALGAHPAFDDEYRAALQTVTDGFVERRPDGSAPPLGTLRTNEHLFDWDWDLREFRLVAGALAPSPTRNTPDQSLNGSEDLVTWVLGNQDEVTKELHVIPDRFLGGHVPATVRWSLPGVPEPLRKHFASQTCGGCHQTETTPVDANFHVSPFHTGVERLSPFLNDPTNPGGDELAKREGLMQTALCSGL
jgi:hypothetical protein